LVSQIPESSERRSQRRSGDLRRILFVDDDDLILRSIARVLKQHALESGWELSFVTDGDEALKLLAQAPFDVVLVDAQMPRMSGATLLARVQELYPNTVRIVLSGHSDAAVLRPALRYAHQVMQKPCDAHVLRNTLDSACGVRAIFSRPELRPLVSGASELPFLPRTYVELGAARSMPGASARAIADIIERDVVLSARVLELCASGAYRLPRPVSSIAGAVAFLGVELIKALVLAVEVSQMFPVGRGVADFSLEALQKRGFAGGQLAKRILGYEPNSDSVLQAGLLQDIGQLVLASRAPQRFAIALQSSASGKLPLYQAELGLLGVTHAEIGASLLGLWGLPEKLVQTVAHHVQPNPAARSFDAAAALYVANLLIENPDLPAQDSVPARAVALDLHYLRSLGVAQHLEDWRRFARELTGDRAPARAARP